MRTRTKFWMGGMVITLAASGVAWWMLSATPESFAAAPLDLASIGFGESAEPIVPLPQAMDLDAGKVMLGNRLFEDKRLSADDTVACASCHSLEKGGADASPQSTGIHGRKGLMNAPTVFNVAFNFRQFWDGRAATLEEQIDGPIANPNEMGSSWAQILEKLHNDASYVHEFAAVYDKAGMTPATIRDAIATYERSLTTPNSRFDRYLRGEPGALTKLEIDGYEKFRSYGCISCHQGVNVGGNLFERLGVMDPAMSPQVAHERRNLGRAAVTGRNSDVLVFKVPSLRNVALTAPYFHDGSVATLEDAVFVMAKVQLGVTLPKTDADAIVAFLRTLTGEYRGLPL